MRLDIRLPLGLLFSIIGLLLLIFGLASNHALYDRSLGVNLNFWWGLVLVLFGLGMLVLGRLGHRRPLEAAASADNASQTASRH